MSDYCIVITTFGKSDDADRVIDSVLGLKLAACVQTLGMESHYRWKGEISHDREILVLFKTKKSLYPELEAKIKELHPYETPEIVMVGIEEGFKGYFDWIDEVTK